MLGDVNSQIMLEEDATQSSIQQVTNNKKLSFWDNVKSFFRRICITNPRVIFENGIFKGFSLIFQKKVDNNMYSNQLLKSLIQRKNYTFRLLMQKTKQNANFKQIRADIESIEFDSKYMSVINNIKYSVEIEKVRKSLKNNNWPSLFEYALIFENFELARLLAVQDYIDYQTINIKMIAEVIKESGIDKIEYLFSKNIDSGTWKSFAQNIYLELLEDKVDETFTYLSNKNLSDSFVKGLLSGFFSFNSKEYSDVIKSHIEKLIMSHKNIIDKDILKYSLENNHNPSFISDLFQETEIIDDFFDSCKHEEDFDYIFKGGNDSVFVYSKRKQHR